MLNTYQFVIWINWSNLDGSWKYQIWVRVVAVWVFLIIFVLSFFSRYFLFENVIETIYQIVVILFLIVWQWYRFKLFRTDRFIIGCSWVGIDHIVSVSLQGFVSLWRALVCIFVFGYLGSNLSIRNWLLIFDDIFSHIVHIFVVITIPTFGNLLLKICWFLAIILIIFLIWLIFIWLLLT